MDRTTLLWLIAAAIATAVLWQIPVGNYILYPFSILATWFHEMGHGLTAIILGGRFERLLIYGNGSGLAYHSGHLFLGPIGRAMVAAGGPMGPAFAGSVFILASQTARTSRLALLLLGSLLLVSALIWVRSLFGLLFVPLSGLAILTVALLGTNWMQRFMIQFLGVQACISLFHQLDYLFTNQAMIGGQLRLSDSGQIASQLLLPHWFWGGLMVIASVVMLIQTLRVTYRL